MKLNKCTDKPWLCLFTIFFVALLIIGIFSIVNGNYLAIINGFDTFGNICGVKHNTPFNNVTLSGLDTSEKPYVLFFALKDVANVLRICVNECPDDYYNEDAELVAHWQLKDFKYCRYDFDMKHILEFYLYINYKTSIGPCPKGNLRQSYVLKRRCVAMDFPTKLQETYSLINSIFGTISLVFINVYLTWPHIVALGGLALLISLAFSIIIWWQQKTFSWIICVLVLMTNGGFCAALWYANENFPQLGDGTSIVYYLFEEFRTNNKILFVTAVLSTIITILVPIALVFIRKKITKTIFLFDGAVVCQNDLKDLVIFTLITLLVLIGFTYVWTYVMLCMTTANNPKILPYTKSYEEDSELGRVFDEQYKVFTKVQYIEEITIRNLWWTYILGLIWTTKFIFACEEFCLDTAVAICYFKPMNSRNKNVLKLLFRFHLGTVAKGSFIFPLLVVPRILFTTCVKLLNIVRLEAVKKLSQNVETLQNNIRAVNHCLYAVVAMETIDLCSARKATKLMMPSEVITMNNITRFILFLAKLTVANVVGVIGMVLLRGRPDVHFYMAPVLYSVVLAFCIAHVILSFFEKVFDTIVFCVAKEKCGGGGRGHLEQTNLSKVFKDDQFLVKQVQVFAIPIQPRLNE